MNINLIKLGQTVFTITGILFLLNDLSGQTYSHRVGKKNYEIKDHLDNVIATVSDVKNYKPSTNSYSANIQSYSQYYPYGMQMPGRNYFSSRYRFGYIGMEMDNELKGLANSLNFNARIYDPRLAVWLSVDPLQMKFPGLSPYNYCFNNPIRFVDKNGMEPQFYEDGRFKGMNDANKSQTITVVRADGSTFNTNLTLSQLVDRAAWIIHEGGGVGADHYAHAIQNIRSTRKSENVIYSSMVSSPDDKGLSPDELKNKYLYDESTPFGKRFSAIKSTPEKISDGEVGRTAVKAIFDAGMGTSADPTGGAYGWAGGDHVQFAYALNHAKSGTNISVIRNGKNGLLNIFYQEDFADRRSRKITAEEAKEYLYMHDQLSSYKVQLKDAKNIEQWRAAKDAIEETENKITDFETTHYLFNNKITVE